ncbi:uncharacterized protein LAJ45_05340 [Morchella importuna]|uniref:uncharacterized protein n=1 Tax=Morchella importuna TaxID=1174673 RepID=UPI001E8CE3A6|nr:uncharacterized protein LAJ45_05340 [Morchella importuna]KAH8150644.1 hypothetical protein LAJ45_05340 [Morchella importuna]
MSITIRFKSSRQRAKSIELTLRIPKVWEEQGEEAPLILKVGRLLSKASEDKEQGLRSSTIRQRLDARSKKANEYDDPRDSSKKTRKK